MRRCLLLLKYLCFLSGVASTAGSEIYCPRFLFILESQANCRLLFDTLHFTFAPGLAGILSAKACPSLSWFKNLPTDIPLHHWGIYVHVLEQKGRTSRIYIGSGTSAARGVRRRLWDYRYGYSLPQYVKLAFDNGFKITHTALLARCPTPDAGNIPRHRAVVIALEAAFACVFWAMFHKDKSYGFADLCPWKPDTFAYKGLCSHNPLLESIIGNLDFSSEQLSEMAARTKERQRLNRLVYNAKMRANPTPSYIASRNANNLKQLPGTKAREQAAIAVGKYRCEPCGINHRNKANLTKHNATPRHIFYAARGGKDPFSCDHCNVQFKYQSEFKPHLTTKGHLSPNPTCSTSCYEIRETCAGEWPLCMNDSRLMSHLAYSRGF
ncbi:hypothetical protein EJ08DRAFT_637794 [Tothia fuscella]|uniref:C2H2-type domain-containing protein n=1 Tax=Tothia fuscella TaxID=1048955 RepID=A0A9P4TWG3_9PEZI|nr:hypothetical protein EJ08DRAFT_637794 [Tothia fuscella]